eukprot:Hpha_TRINITY_DN15834_c1_g1::TRINITY_DN15834_c1_g1_i5::g.190538::m.190538
MSSGAQCTPLWYSTLRWYHRLTNNKTTHTLGHGTPGFFLRQKLTALEYSVRGGGETLKPGFTPQDEEARGKFWSGRESEDKSLGLGVMCVMCKSLAVLSTELSP